MLDKKLIIVTPWFGRFAGGAELLARGLAIEFSKRGVETVVFTTCSLSPYHNWWEDYHEKGIYKNYGVETHRFPTDRAQDRYVAAVSKLQRSDTLTDQEKADFFLCGINSQDLVNTLKSYLSSEYEVVAFPYFQGLTHSAVNTYPGQISLIPCFHDEPQFYCEPTERLLANAKHIFFNSIEEKKMAIKRYGHSIGRKIVESAVTGVGVELDPLDEESSTTIEMPNNYFVYVGRKETGKNVHLLCQWFKHYVEEFQGNAKLVFVGGGDQSLLPKSDIFLDLGVVSEATKRNIVKNSRGLINLSENESFSVVIMEAWLLQVPVIVSSRCAVTKSHIKRCHGGLYVENIEEFALALEYLEGNNKVAKRLGVNGKKYVSQEFSFDKVLHKYLVQFADN